MLHIRPGDDILPKLKEAGIPGEFIRWADALCQGPTPAGLSQTQWRELRARFAADNGYLPYEEALRFLSDQDRNLERFHDHDRVVLWFEHDLFCQINLIYLLDWFSRQEPTGTKLFLICPGKHLGRLDGEALARLFGTEHEIAPSEIDLARRTWSAFCAPDPTGIERVLQGDTAPLPFLRDALLRHLQEFPSTENGLNLTERLALEVIASGESRPDRIFRSVNDREAVFWMGDGMFYASLKRLTAGPSPLLNVNGSDAWPTAEHPTTALTVEMTEAGRAVLAGKADWIGLNGIDRWLGGVHLRSEQSLWRWDDRQGRLITSTSESKENR